MNPIGPIEFQNPVIEIQNEEVVQRRAVIADLQQLDLILQQQRMTDELSQNLRSWVGHFMHLLNLNAPMERVADKMIQQVHLLLRNPFGACWPFGDQVYLGNDGHCYSRKALAVYLSCCEKEYLQRSPTMPYKPEPFFLIKPHSTVYTVQMWLISHGIELLESEVDRLYTQLEQQGRLAEIPLGRPVVKAGSVDANLEKRKQRFLALQKQREQEQVAKQSQENKKLEEEVIQKIAAIEKEAEANFQKTTERIENFFQGMQEKLAQQGEANQALKNDVTEMMNEQQKITDRVHKLQKDISQEGFEKRKQQFDVKQYQRQENMEKELNKFVEFLQEAMVQGAADNEEMLQMRNAMAQRFKGFNERLVDLAGDAKEQLKYLQKEVIEFHVVNLEAQIKNIDEKNKELEPRLHKLGEGILTVKQQQAALQISINNLDRAMKKKERSFLINLGINLLQLGCYRAGTAALSSWIQGLSASPTKNYGTLLSYVKKF